MLLSNLTFCVWGVLFIPFVWGLRKKLPLPFMCMLTYALGVGIWHLLISNTGGSLLNIYLAQSQVHAFVAVMLSGYFLAYLSRSPGVTNSFKNWAAVYAFILSFYLIWRGGHAHLYFFDNATQAAWFVAVSAGFVLVSSAYTSTQAVILAIMGAGILRSNATTPMAAYLVVVMFFLHLKIPKLIYQIPTIAFLVILSGLLHPPHDWMDPGTRIAAWKLAVHWWEVGTWRAWLFGHGLGSVKIVFPYMQSLLGVKPGSHGLYVALHNDYLQILVELGAIGFGLFIWCVWWMARNSNIYRVIPLIAYGVLMTVNFPTHFPTTMFLGLIVVGNILSYDTVARGEMRRR